VDGSAPGCGMGFDQTVNSPCIDQTVFGPTVASFWWSATTDATQPLDAWGVSFSGGEVYSGGKADGGYVRGVRSGL
jgi:hypothetical protein